MPLELVGRLLATLPCLACHMECAGLCAPSARPTKIKLNYFPRRLINFWETAKVFALKLLRTGNLPLLSTYMHLHLYTGVVAVCSIRFARRWNFIFSYGLHIKQMAVTVVVVVVVTLFNFAPCASVHEVYIAQSYQS